MNARRFPLVNARRRAACSLGTFKMAFCERAPADVCIAGIHSVACWLQFYCDESVYIFHRSERLSSLECAIRSQFHHSFRSLQFAVGINCICRISFPYLPRSLQSHPVKARDREPNSSFTAYPYIEHIVGTHITTRCQGKTRMCLFQSMTSRIRKRQKSTPRTTRQKSGSRLPNHGLKKDYHLRDKS